MAHFYLDDSLASQLSEAGREVGAIVRLRGADARHAAAVSRVRPGERLRLGDGAGLVVLGTVSSAESTEVALEVEHVERTPRPATRIHLVQALAKGDRDELAVQAATELGVDVVVPWQAARSISRWDAAKAVKGRERWTTIAREASKQSLRPWLPEVEAVAATKQLVDRLPQATMLVLDPEGDVALTELGAAALGVDDIVLVVGPEGGIAPEEFEALTTAGARRVRLGSTVLRTSTAGPAAIAVLSAALGRW
ncbi:16S rRNA (uracil(1498)-N(3))-methyltransferase [Microcella sp.]|uniref:16S rRNA (uracil(1498)-N(3))-methyltransferase n=1 Tax=Microcella sp. TaxID=1913979 RepID=UPI0025642330|nr:16S rRNA (uracil(1498)-N(3))-methyltransferase [Microcella sp.]MBX9471010.1 16S rRNA (uracil(1498)-N(3))-methyltransferase [Microcella sp.]